MTIENANKAKELLEKLDWFSSDLKEINELRETWRHYGKKISLEITEDDEVKTHLEITERQGELVFETLLNTVETQINDIKAKIESL